MRNTIRLLMVLLLAVVMSACGGGSGGGGGEALPVDQAFTLSNQGFSTQVEKVAPAKDGSGDIYVGGDFISYNGTIAGRIIRLNSDATADSAFATGNGFNYGVAAISVANDDSGDVYVGGHFTDYDGTAINRIARLNSDGTRDDTFAVGSGFSGSVYAIAPAGDGSGDIYVGGSFTSYNGAAINRLVRLNSDGSVDSGFATGSGINGNVITIAPTTDGSGDVYVGGIFTSYNGGTANYITRLNSDGTTDTGFVVGSGFNSYIFSIAPTDDGSGDVYVCGYFSTYNGVPGKYLVRLNSDGSRDSSFDIGTGFNLYIYDIALATDGSGDIYVGGPFTSYNGSASNYLARLNSDGTLDSAFTSANGFDKNISSVVAAGDGSGELYALGYFSIYDGNPSSSIVRLSADGSVSQTYSQNVAFSDYVNALSPADDGSGDIYAGGYFTHYNGVASNRIARLNSDGTMDTAFDTGSGFDEAVLTIAPAADGSGDIYVGGYFTSYNGATSNYIVRLNSDGTVDTTFVVGSGLDNYVASIAPATDGSGDIYVGGGFSAYDGTASSRIVRLNSDGTVDSAFAVGSGFNNGVTSIAPAVDNSGDIYASGYFASYNGSTSRHIVRLNNDGTVDSAFNVGTGLDGSAFAIVPLADGSLYLGGGFTIYNGATANSIVCLNSDGTVDTTFVVGSGFNSELTSLAPAGDGSGDIYAGGWFSSYNGTSSSYIIRLNSDGTVDSTFATGSGFDSHVKTLAPASDGFGDIYIGGDFSAYQNTTALRVIALSPDGSID